MTLWGYVSFDNFCRTFSYWARGVTYVDFGGLLYRIVSIRYRKHLEYVGISKGSGLIQYGLKNIVPSYNITFCIVYI